MHDVKILSHENEIKEMEVFAWQEKFYKRNKMISLDI